MKQLTIIRVTFYLFLIFLIACGKDGPLTDTDNTNPDNPDPGTNTPLLIGGLSIQRYFIAGGAAGSKVMFAGGAVGEQDPLNLFSRVDIYDTLTRGWSTAELSEARAGIGAVSIGNKILFAGGAKNFDYNIGWYNLTTRVDIYDAGSNTWSITELPEPQMFHEGCGAASSIGNKAYFYSITTSSNRIYIYDISSNSWSSTPMNGPRRYDFAIAGNGSKLLFGGGSVFDGGTGDRVDILNTNDNRWMLVALSEPRFMVKATTVNNKTFFAGGVWRNINGTRKVDIYDNTTQHWLMANLSRATVLVGAVTVGNKAIFIDRNIVNTYNDVTGVWSVDTVALGGMEFDHQWSTIVPSGNSVYIAGARRGNTAMFSVWKLIF